MQGETETGITIMQTAIGIDDGDMILKHPITILPHYTAGDLTQEIANQAPEILLNALNLIENNRAEYQKQNEEEATHFPMLKSINGKLWLEKSATEIVNQIRGVTPNPGAYVVLGNKQLKVFKAIERPDILVKASCGSVLQSSAKRGLVLACGNNQAIELLEVQAPNGKRMTAKSYLCGNTIPEGEVAQ